MPVLTPELFKDYTWKSIIPDCELPDDKFIFQKIDKDILKYAVLPKGDYSEFIFDGCDMRGVVFPDGSTLPKDRDWMTKVKNKSMRGVEFPAYDFSEYHFDGVDIIGATFKPGTIFPKDFFLFQKIREKSLNNTKMPTIDMNEYCFDGVDISYTDFPQGTVMSRDRNFFSVTNTIWADLGVYLKGIFNLFDYNYSNVNIGGMKFVGQQSLPNDLNFMQRLSDKSIDSCIFENCDLTEYNFNDVEIHSVQFYNCKLPKDADFFQKIREKHPAFTSLPDLDLNIYNMVGVNISGVYFTKDTIFPTNKDFFQKIKGKSCRRTILPTIDLRNYNIKGVDFMCANREHVSGVSGDTKFFKLSTPAALKFYQNEIRGMDLSGYDLVNVELQYTDLRECILPSNKDLFRRSKSRSIRACKLPKMDLSQHDFDKVVVLGTVFHKDTILPDDTELFQKIAAKSLQNTVMPAADYSRYNFNGVLLMNTTFPEGSKMPIDENFLSGLSKRSNLRNTKFPREFIDRIYLQNLDNVKIDIRKLKLCDMHNKILIAKYGRNANITLPKRGIRQSNANIAL